jgi:hypothetical protein
MFVIIPRMPRNPMRRGIQSHVPKEMCCPWAEDLAAGVGDAGASVWSVEKPASVVVYHTMLSVGIDKRVVSSAMVEDVIVGDAVIQVRVSAEVDIKAVGIEDIVFFQGVSFIRDRYQSNLP